MLNPQIVNGLAKLGVNPQKLQQAIDQASPYMSQVNSRQDAAGVLQKLGVNRETMRRARKLLDNPLAPAIAKMAGVDLNAVKDGVSQLSGDVGEGPQATQAYQHTSAATSDVASLKAALGRIK